MQTIFQNLGLVGQVWLVGVFWAPLDEDFESHVIVQGTKKALEAKMVMFSVILVALLFTIF
jgi:hypothetical protein